MSYCGCSITINSLLCQIIVCNVKRIQLKPMKFWHEMRALRFLRSHKIFNIPWLKKVQNDRITNHSCNSVSSSKHELNRSSLHENKSIIFCSTLWSPVPDLTGCIYIHVTQGSVQRLQWGRGHPELKRRWLSCSAGLSSLWSLFACGALNCWAGSSQVG